MNKNVLSLLPDRIKRVEEGITYIKIQKFYLGLGLTGLKGKNAVCDRGAEL